MESHIYTIYIYIYIYTIYIYIYIYIHIYDLYFYGGAYDVMAIVVCSEFGHPNSNSVRGCLHFHIALIGMNLTILFGLIVGQTDLFNWGIATDLRDGKL